MKLSACLLGLASGFRPAADRRIVEQYGWTNVDERTPVVCGENVVEWLGKWHKEAEIFFTQDIIAQWEYNVNLTDANEAIQDEADAAFKAWAKVKTEEGKTLFKELLDICEKDINSIECCLEDEKNGGSWTKEAQWRALDKILTYKIYGEKDMDSSALGEASFDVYQKSLGQMIRTFSTTKVNAEDGSAALALDGDGQISGILTEMAGKPSEASYETQKYYWANWHKKVGQACKKSYEDFVVVSNEAAELNGYTDTGDSWRDWYEDDQFEQLVDGLWNDVKPLYEKLHGYARYVLNKAYGNDHVSNGKDPVPAHLMGNMWAQDWAGLSELMEPHPGVGERPDATPELQKLEILDMYMMADEFYQSLGLFPMTAKFWHNSVFEKKTDVDMVCHASAWDFMAGDGLSDDGTRGDYRIKQCTEKIQSEFVTLHHEMGHIQYFQQYAHQPIIFRSGANPGFHEAIGDTIALAVNTPAHLAEVNLLPGWTPSEGEESLKTDLNFLMMTALDKITFLPFGLLMDKYRWMVFRGNDGENDITPDDYQSLWDSLRLEYQGLISPVKRTKEDFDPAAKFHTSNNVPYIRYFISFVIQFQFYERMCIKAGQYDPNDPSSKLYQCDFFNDENAGKVMQDMLREGNSRNWAEVLADFLCDDDTCKKGDAGKLSARSLVKYFAPLETWLDEQQTAENYQVGWDMESTWKPAGFDDFPEEAALDDTPPPPEEPEEPSDESNTTTILLSTIFLGLWLL